MRSRVATAVIALLLSFVGAVQVVAQPPTGQDVQQKRLEHAPLYETVWFTLLFCKNSGVDGVIVVAPSIAEISQQGNPQRIVWAINDRANFPNHKWEIKWKGDDNGSKDIFPGDKKIDNSAFDAWFSKKPYKAKGGNFWEYEVVVTTGDGKPCATADPQIVVKDDPAPPPDDE